MTFATNSVQYAAQILGNAKSADVSAKLRAAFFSKTYTAAEQGTTGEMNIVKLPAGKIRVFPDLSRVFVPDGASGMTIDVGNRKYIGQDGVEVIEDDNSLHDNGACGSGDLDAALALPAVGYIEFDSQDGVIIYASFDTAGPDGADTLTGYIVFAQGN